MLVAIQNKIRISNGKKPKESGCTANCASCGKQCENRTEESKEGMEV
jgi:hypothetical protein